MTNAIAHRTRRQPPLILANLLFSWYRTAPAGRRMSATWLPTKSPTRIRGQVLAPDQYYLTVEGGVLAPLSLWPRSSIVPESLAEAVTACGPRLIRAYEYASAFITDNLEGGFLPGTPLVLSELRLPHLRPFDGQRPAAPTHADPGLDLTFSAFHHGIGSTTFALRAGHPPELRLISAWPLLKDQPVRGHFWAEHSLGPKEIGSTLAPLWAATPRAIKPTGRAMVNAAPLFATLARGILGELGV